MAAIQYLDNQPIQFYKVDPSGSELYEGQQKWDQTAYHKRRETDCDFTGIEYCHPATFEDIINFQFKLATSKDDVIQPGYSCFAVGSNDSLGAFKLYDSTATFISSGLDGGMSVANLTTGEGSYILNVDSETELTLNADIFQDYADYQICTILLTGDSGITTGSNYTSYGSSSLTIESSMIVDAYYRVELTVSDITSGSFQVFLGSNPIATIDSVGTHVLYGQALSNGTFNIVGNFTGTVLVPSIKALELQTEYLLTAFDLDGNYIGSDAINALDTQAWTIGNGMVGVSWSNLVSECGSYVLGLSIDNEFCLGEMIVDGEFDGKDGWTTSEGVEIEDGIAVFFDASPGSYLTNDLNCVITAGNSYTMTWDISNCVDVKFGNYTIRLEDGTVVSPVYNAATQSGTVTLTFTAPVDSNTISFVANTLASFCVDVVSMECNDCSLSEDEVDGLSECYCVCDTQDCTSLIVYSAYNPTFGNWYNSGSPEMRFRIQCRVKNPQTPGLQTTGFKSVKDRQLNPYSNMNRVQEIATTLVPEWVHNTMAVILQHPLLAIDGIGYQVTEAYTVDWGEEETARGVATIAKVNQSGLRSNY